MSERMNRRALLSAACFPIFLITCVSGCGGGNPDRLVSGTLAKPIDFVEKADEEAAKKFEAEAKSRRSRKR